MGGWPGEREAVDPHRQHRGMRSAALLTWVSIDALSGGHSRMTIIVTSLTSHSPTIHSASPAKILAQSAPGTYDLIGAMGILRMSRVRASYSAAARFDSPSFDDVLACNSVFWLLTTCHPSDVRWGLIAKDGKNPHSELSTYTAPTSTCERVLKAAPSSGATTTYSHRLLTPPTCIADAAVMIAPPPFAVQ